MPDNPTTIILKQPPTFREYLIIAIAIVLAILFWKSCSSSDTLRTAALQKEDSIQAQKLLIIHLRNDSIALNKRLTDSAARIHTIDSNKWVQKSIEAQVWQNRAQRLSYYIDSSTPQHSDTAGYVLVPTPYLDSCEACSISLKQAIRGIDSARALAAQTSDLVTYELLIRERAAIIQQQYSDSLQSLFNAQSQVVTALAKAGKPKAQIYAGVEIMGGPVTVFQNTGGVLSLKTKKDKLYQISGGITNLGTWYARINANFKIKLHK